MQQQSKTRWQMLLFVALTVAVIGFAGWYCLRPKKTQDVSRCPLTYEPAHYQGMLKHRGLSYRISTCSEQCLLKLQQSATSNSAAFDRHHGAEKTARGLLLHHQGRLAQHAPHHT